MDCGDLGELRVDEAYCLTIVDATTLLATLDDARRCIFHRSCGDIQRSLDAEHLEELLEYQEGLHSRKGRYSFPTPLIVARRGEQYALVDGQHRLEAIRRLLAGGAELPPIPVGVFQIKDVDEYDELFLAINKSKPVQLYRNVRDYKEVLRHVKAFFQDNFALFLKSSNRPRRPCLNVDNLLAYIDEHGLLARLGLSADALIREIEEINKCYCRRWRTLLAESHIPSLSTHARTCRTKQPANPLFLGLFQHFEWVHRIVERVEYDRAYEEMSHPRSDMRQSIPKTMRRKVWQKRCSEKLVGACYTCGEALSYDAFECGHVVAVVDGGKSVIDNLEPVCQTCNRDMGTMNLEAYRAKLG